MSTLIEQVSLALQHHQTRHGPDYDGMARAAIMAIQYGLTDSMAEVISAHGRCCGGIAQNLWVETFDVALAEHPSDPHQTTVVHIPLATGAPRKFKGVGRPTPPSAPQGSA